LEDLGIGGIIILNRS